MVYNIPPSIFAYFECERCFWLERKGKMVKPSMPFPGVFGALDSAQKKFTLNKDLQKLSPVLPQGRFVKLTTDYVSSAPITIEGVDLRIRGKIDCLARHADGTYGVYDLKTIRPNDDVLERYNPQLAAYAYALAHPADGICRYTPVSTVGLLCFYPGKACGRKQGYMSQRMEMTGFVGKPDYDLMFDILKVCARILKMDTPPPAGHECKTCARVAACARNGW